MSNPFYVTTMVFNRHDLLANLFASIRGSLRKPEKVYVVDHGYDEGKIRAIEPQLGGVALEILTFDDYSCAHAANWILQNVPDDKVGCGDDVTFAPSALGTMVDTPGDFVIPDHVLSPLNPGACCLIRKGCTDRIGFFDEKISPHFLYHEDSDFIRRMELAGIPQTVAKGAMVSHHDGGSQTMKLYTPAQMDEHHYRFRISQANYVRKWGGLPFHETLTEPRAL